MASNLIAERSFTAEDQEQFARLSGDRNPMHMDATLARRTMAGFPVVHGIHSLLWSLDALWRVIPDFKPAGLRARFEKMVHVGDHVQLVVVERNCDALRFDIMVEGVSAVRGRLNAVAAVPPTPSLSDAPLLAPAVPCDLDFAQAVAACGRIDLFSAPERAARMFPAAAAGLGAGRVAWLACSSFLVGMACPGLHSIYNSLELVLTEATQDTPLLHFAPHDNDPRFRLVRMHVWGGGWDGTVEAFVRPQPVAQPNIASIASTVASGEFLGVSALVIGGSRGLGEVAAKILAAGGAKVTVTYNRGKAEACKVQDEIHAVGGYCEVLCYDVLQDAEQQLVSLQMMPNQLYYFATPPIFRRKVAVLTPGRFEDFLAFYVTGFYWLCRALGVRTGAKFAAFYPSSTSVDSRPANMTEYTMAKIAGEVLCADMQRFENMGPILVQRLPRLPTDQTATLSPVAAADPLDVLLPIVREMKSTTPT